MTLLSKVRRSTTAMQRRGSVNVFPFWSTPPGTPATQVELRRLSRPAEVLSHSSCY